ncbi:PIR protein [Plasmodium ovale]|uniref:PIR protein n=1 Tax=Plasmodium ovale TaxID=36330 RepID=A0A1C3KJY8_PLAOA|nr:PIR protein [Plasmodium ovale]
MTINSTNENYQIVELYLYYYNILNKTQDPTSDIPTEFFNEHFPNGIDNRSKFIKNCKRLNYYITRSISTECHNNHACFEITNYWLNDEVRSDSDKINSAHLDKYKEFMEKYDKLKSYVKNIYYINTELFNKKKVLYELYNKYDKLLAMELSIESDCVHLANLVDGYNSIIDKYTQKHNSNFSVALTDFRNHVQKKVEENKTLCNSKIPEFKSFVEKPFASAQETGGLYQSTGYIGEFPSNPSENLASTFTITFFGTSVGVFLTLIIFYKITLFGYNLRNKKNNNIIIPNNLDEEIYELPVYTSEENDRNSQYSTYNITYQSLENS